LGEKALLPPGLADVLPPETTAEASAVEHLIDAFQSHGYERIKPPLMEFEPSLLSGTGAAMVDQTFRLMDPASQRMMGLRADMTPQAARIAATRLAGRPRPLRVAYAGDVLRVQGSQLRPERQFVQVGAELIGAEGDTADAEVIAMAVETLGHLGITDISVDLGQPRLVTAILEDLGIGGEAADRLRQALDRKDAAETTQASARADAHTDGKASALLPPLLDAVGPAQAGLDHLHRLPLGPAGEQARQAFAGVVLRLGEAIPKTVLTLDPVENRGFEYHSGVTFTFFAPGVRGELGSGGRYLAGGDDGNGSAVAEPATGFTLFMDTILRALPAAEAPTRLFVPLATPRHQAAVLRDEGWITVMSLDGASDDADEARRMGCSHLLTPAGPAALDETGE